MINLDGSHASVCLICTAGGWSPFARVHGRGHVLSLRGRASVHLCVSPALIGSVTDTRRVGPSCGVIIQCSVTQTVTLTLSGGH